MIKRKKNSGKTAGLFSKNGRASSRKKTASTYTLELLESRVLLSGDLAGAVQAMQIKPVQVPAQAVVLNVPAAPAAFQQTVSVADMLAKPASSFNQFAGESSRANSNAANHASDAVVSKGTGEGRQHSWSDKNHGNSQFVTPVQSQPSTPKNSANVVNAISPSLQLASTSQAQNEHTPMTSTALQSDMTTMPPIMQSQPISQSIVTTMPTAVNAPVSQTIPTSQIVAQPVSSTPQVSNDPSLSQTTSQSLVTPVQTTPTVVDASVSQVQAAPTSQIVAEPVSSTTQPSQTISQPVVAPVQTVSSTLAPVQTVTSSPSLIQPTVSSIQTVQPTQTVSQPISTTTVTPTVPITTPTTTSTFTSDAINPTLPQATVDTSMPSTSVTVTVGSQGADYTDLQQALNNVSLDTTILLQPGAYMSNNSAGFILPNKPGTGWIVIRPAADSQFPPSGTRIDPSYANVMPTILRSPYSNYAMSVAPGAHNYRIVGVQFMNPGNADTPYNGAFVNLDGIENSIAAQSNNIILDRVYIHSPSDPGTVGVNFGVVLGGRYQAVIDSDIEGMHSSDGEAKAIVGWNGAGPWLISNNLLSASGENMMIGGATPLLNGLTPSDITITHNDFYKPLAWRDDPAYTTGPNPVLIKNLLELKNAERVLIDGNTFQNVWPNGQSGQAIVLTPRGGGSTGSDPWTTVSDITITDNKLVNVANGFAISGGGPTISLDQGGPTQRGGRILIENNVFIGLGGDYASSDLSGNFATIGMGPSDLQIKHNSVVSYAGTAIRGTTLYFSYGVPDEGALFPLSHFVLQDNIFGARSYPMILSAAANLDTLMPGYVWTNNVFAGPWPTSGGWTPAMMPQGNGNAYPMSMANIGYTNVAGGDYSLSSISPYKGAASDGTDIGINWNQFNAANS